MGGLGLVLLLKVCAREKPTSKRVKAELLAHVLKNVSLMVAIAVNPINLDGIVGVVIVNVKATQLVDTPKGKVST